MAIAFSEVLKTTGSTGQRKGLEPYAGRIVTLRDFKIDERGRGTDANGNPKAKVRVLTASVHTDGLKPRRARMPRRYATRFMEAIELRADDAEPFEVRDVYVKGGEHGVTLSDPAEIPVAEGGWMQPSANGTAARRPGRPRRQQPEQPAAA